MAVSATAAAVISATSAIASIAMMLMNKPQNTEVDDSGVSLSRKGKNDPKTIAFGNCRIPASKMFSNVNDNDTKYMVQVHSLGYGPLKAVREIYFDQVAYFTNPESDYSDQWYTSGNTDDLSNVQLGIRRGTFGEVAWQQIIDNSDGLWTAAHRGDRTASVAQLVERVINQSEDDNVRIMSTTYNVEALVDGNAVIDPRFDTTLVGVDPVLRAWVNEGIDSYRNPACVILTYLLDKEFGFGLPTNSIDLNSFISVANWCDTNVIKFDGFIDQGDTFGAIIEQLVTSFGGFVFVENGKLKIMPSAEKPVLYHIIESDLIGNITVTNNDESTYFNTIKCEYWNSANNYTQDMYVLPAEGAVDPAIIADGQIIEQTFQMPFSTSVEYIKSFSNEKLKEARLCRKSVDLTVDNITYPLAIGDVFTLTHTLYGLDETTMFIVNTLDNTLDEKTTQVKVKARQYDPTVFDSSSYEDGNTGSVLPPGSYTVLPPTNLQFVQNSTLTTGSGYLSWDCDYLGEHRFLVQYRLSGGDWVDYVETVATEVLIRDLRTGTAYDFRVRTIAPIGCSQWSVISNVMVNRSITLPPVTNLISDFTSADCYLKWDAITGAIPPASVIDDVTDLSQVLDHYEIDVNGTIYRSVTPGFVYTYTQNAQDGLTRDLTITVRGVSIYGDRGDAASITATNTAMAQPSGVVVSSVLVNLTVSWDNPSGVVPDYDQTDVYLMPDEQTLPTAEHLIATTNTGFWTAVYEIEQGYIRIAHRDVFGHTSPITASPAMYFLTQDIDDILTDSEFEDTMDKLEDDMTQAQADIDQAKEDILANANEILSLEEELAIQGAEISRVATIAESNEGKIASLETELVVMEGELTAMIQTNADAIVTTNEAMASMNTTLTAEIDANTAAIEQNSIVIADIDSTLSREFNFEVRHSPMPPDGTLRIP
ncbi:phage tail protein [Aeromonas media]|uniref:phage tail protein n=1 Tax=Aeromonas media TaxID=651 RepID=UPI0038D22326